MLWTKRVSREGAVENVRREKIETGPGASERFAPVELTGIYVGMGGSI